eukprot:UN19756
MALNYNSYPLCSKFRYVSDKPPRTMILNLLLRHLSRHVHYFIDSL